MAGLSRRRPPGAAGRRWPGADAALPLAVAVGVDQSTAGLLAEAAADRSFRWRTVSSLAELAAAGEEAEVAFVAAAQATGSDGADGLAREVVLLFDPEHGGGGPGVWFPARHRHLLFTPLHPGFVAGLFDELGDVLKRCRPGAEPPLPALDRLGPIQGSAPVMREFKQRLLRLAGNGEGVLVYGEPGTETLQTGRMLHRASPWGTAPLVEVDGAGWQRDGGIRYMLRDPERWSGRLQEAGDGSLLLRNVASLAEASQMTLCRLLAMPGGRVRSARLLATTDAQPLEALADGRLCRALYWHVARFVLRVPPLRERGQDVVGLAVRRLQVLNRRHGTARWLEADARDVLCDHQWPGNVEELAAVIDRVFGQAEAEAVIRRDQVASAIDVGQALADGEAR